MTDQTLCKDCDFVETESRKQADYRWLCIRHKRLGPKHRFVTDTLTLKDPPYLYCVDVNGGFCLLFEPRRNANQEEDQ